MLRHKTAVIIILLLSDVSVANNDEGKHLWWLQDSAQKLWSERGVDFWNAEWLSHQWRRAEVNVCWAQTQRKLVNIIFIRLNASPSILLFPYNLCYQQCSDAYLHEAQDTLDRSPCHHTYTCYFLIHTSRDRLAVRQQHSLTEPLCPPQSKFINCPTEHPAVFWGPTGAYTSVHRERSWGEHANSS